MRSSHLLPNRLSQTSWILIILFLLPMTNSKAALQYTGVNLAGADFGEGALPGTFGVHYTYPLAAEVDYFVGKGMNVFRVPFRWERLQQSQNGELDAVELSRLNTFVEYATNQGAKVILDPHNYARYHGDLIGSASVPNSTFSNFWTRMANQFKENENVIFGLMNEPNTMPTEQWRSAANDAIAAIRTTGADNLVLVPGNAWTGAHSWSQNWYGTPNAVEMLNIVDPGNNFAFDLHQYLDNDSSGTTSTIVSENIGQERLVDVTNWLKNNGRKAFLGEFGVDNATIGAGIGDEAINNMLSYMEANDDVWLGWTWWAAGPWWGNYRFTAEPLNLGQPNETDRPVLSVLEPFFADPTPADSPDFNQDGTVDAADYSLWRDSLGQTGIDLAADGNHDEVVDQADYELWRDNYGLVVGSAESTSTTVPEGSTALMLVAITTLSFLNKSSRQR